VNFDLGEARPLHRWLKPAAHRFDFRQFGHRSTGLRQREQGR
jgi:hypothetical protein